MGEIGPNSDIAENVGKAFKSMEKPQRGAESELRGHCRFRSSIISCKIMSETAHLSPVKVTSCSARPASAG